MPNLMMIREAEFRRLSDKVRKRMSFSELVEGLGRARRREVVLDGNPQLYPHVGMAQRIHQTAKDYSTAVNQRVAELF